MYIIYSISYNVYIIYIIYIWGFLQMGNPLGRRHSNFVLFFVDLQSVYTCLLPELNGGLVRWEHHRPCSTPG